MKKQIFRTQALSLNRKHETIAFSLNVCLQTFVPFAWNLKKTVMLHRRPGQKKRKLSK